MLKRLGDKIWVSDSNQTAFGLDIGTRTTVIDIDGAGSLFVHSPLAKQAEEICKLGKTRYVVIPNKWRGKNIYDFKIPFPEAEIFLSIQDGATYPWSEALDHFVIQGSPLFNEAAFFHRASKTLILADHGGYLYDGGPLTAQLGMKLLKSQKHYGWSDQEKKLYIRDKKAFAESAEKLFAWDFERVIIAHGPLIEKEPAAKLREALRLPGPPDATNTV
ncbi:MAG: hypothetical protein ABL958_01260 [Bdellovibrionia bacterium]